MVDKTQPERQRRYRTKLNAERNRVPELEARVRELEAELAALRKGREAVNSEAVAHYDGPDRILFLDDYHGEAFIDGRAYKFDVSHSFSTGLVCNRHVDFVLPSETAEHCKQLRPRIQKLVDEEVKRLDEEIRREKAKELAEEAPEEIRAAKRSVRRKRVVKHPS